MPHHLYKLWCYISVSPTDIQKSVCTLNDYRTDILWMEYSKSKFNVDTSDGIITGTKQQQNKIVDNFPVKYLGNDILPSDTVRNLGIGFAVNSTFTSIFHK